MSLSISMYENLKCILYIPCITLTSLHSLLTNLNFPLTSHLTISPLWFSLSPHHLTLSLKSLSPLSPSYLPTLSPHSLLLSSTSLSLISLPLSHTHTLSLSRHSPLSHLTPTPYLTLPSNSSHFLSLTSLSPLTLSSSHSPLSLSHSLSLLTFSIFPLPTLP